MHFDDGYNPLHQKGYLYISYGKLDSLYFYKKKINIILVYKQKEEFRHRTKLVKDITITLKYY